MEEQKLKFKGGRPITDNPKSKITNTRFTEEEYKIIEQKAKRLNCTIAEYMRQSALNVKILEKRDVKELIDVQKELRIIGATISRIKWDIKYNILNDKKGLEEELNNISNEFLNLHKKYC